jgi:hypothetical protein
MCWTETFARTSGKSKGVNKTRKRLLYKLRIQIREEFDNKQAVIDIERQLSGLAVDEDAKATLQEEEIPPQQIHLLEKLMTWPTSRSVEDELRRRDAGVEAVRVYCGVFEGGPRRGRRPKKSAPDVVTDTDTKTVEQPDLPPWDDFIRATRDHIRLVHRPRACFQCLKWYNRPQDVGRHFRDDHLRYLSDQDPTKCNFCDVLLDNKIHLKAHGKIVHGTHT